MGPFTFYMPTRIIFGPGKLAELGTTPHFTWKKALLVTGQGGSARRSGSLERVRGLSAGTPVKQLQPDVERIFERAYR